jgi:hypothetical protein
MISSARTFIETVQTTVQLQEDMLNGPLKRQIIATGERIMNECKNLFRSRLSQEVVFHSTEEVQDEEFRVIYRPLKRIKGKFIAGLSSNVPLIYFAYSPLTLAEMVFPRLNLTPWTERTASAQLEAGSWGNLTEAGKST